MPLNRPPAQQLAPRAAATIAAKPDKGLPEKSVGTGARELDEDNLRIGHIVIVARLIQWRPHATTWREDRRRSGTPGQIAERNGCAILRLRTPRTTKPGLSVAVAAPSEHATEPFIVEPRFSAPIVDGYRHKGAPRRTTGFGAPALSGRSGQVETRPDSSPSRGCESGSTRGRRSGRIHSCWRARRRSSVMSHWKQERVLWTVALVLGCQIACGGNPTQPSPTSGVTVVPAPQLRRRLIYVCQRLPRLQCSAWSLRDTRSVRARADR